MATPRNFTNNASGASLNGALSAGATTALLNNYSNFPAAPFTATIGRNQTDEEIVLVTAVAGSTVTITRGYDGTAGQAHSAGASFEHTAIAKDFRDASAHVESTGAVHGLAGSIVGDSDTQVLTNKTVKLLKALATNSGAAVEADNDTGATGKLFRGLQAGVEKWFIDNSGNMTGQSVTGTTGTFSGALSAAATTLTSLTVSGGATVTGLLTANGGITVPTGKKITVTDAAVLDTDAANAGYAKGLFLTPPTSRKVVVSQGTGTAFPGSPLEGDVFLRTDIGTNGTLFTYTGVSGLGVSGWLVNGRIVCTSSTRPSGLYAGVEIYETDTARSYRWLPSGTVIDGTAMATSVWDQFAGPPEIYPISYAAAYGDLSGYSPVRAYKMGRQVTMDGAFLPATSAGNVIGGAVGVVIGALPAAVTPDSVPGCDVSLWAPGGSSGRINVFVNGNVQFTPWAATSSGWNASFSGLTWRTHS